MYLSNTTEKVEIVLAGAVTTNQLEWTASYQDITSAGMTLPQSSSQGLTNSTTAVDMVAAPAASTNRQVVHITVYNDDTAAATVKIRKDVSGTEYIYVNQTLQAGDTLQWSREDGWRIISGTSQARYTFDVYNTAGSFTWTKPAGLKSVIVFVGGAGGGGGSGARLAAATNRFGGGGGGGGAFNIQLLDASSLASSIAVTVGAAGTGAAAVLVDSTNGASGVTGGLSQFGSVQAAGGSGGGGGSTASGAGGNGGGTIQYLPYNGTGSSGGTSNTNTTATAGSPGFSVLSGQIGCPGGGGGSGINNANVSATAGGAGGGVYQNGVLIAGPSSGATPNGVNNKNIFLHMSQVLTSSTGVGTGGAGGYPGFYNGGNGGYCAGGGGGSGSLNGTASGSGGNGGNGLVIVMNIF